MRAATLITGVTVLVTVSLAVGQVPVWHNTLEDLTASTIDSGQALGSAPSFQPGIVSPPLTTVYKWVSTASGEDAATGGSRVFWGTTAVQTIFAGWTDANGITVDLYFSGFGPGVTRDSGLWSVGHRNSDDFLIIAVRNDTLRVNIRNDRGPDAGATRTIQTGNLGLIASETYRVTVRQHVTNGDGGDIEVYLDDLGGSIYSNATPIATLNLVSNYVFHFPLEAGSGPALGMTIGDRHPFTSSDNGGTVLNAGEAVDEVRVFNGNYTPAELDVGGLPVAVIQADKTSGRPSLTVNFDGSASYDTNGGTIVKYEWDFDNNGTIDDSSGALVSHVYSSAGDYVCKLTVTDNDNKTASATLPIHVTRPELARVTDILPTGGPLTGSQILTSITADGFTVTDFVGPTVAEGTGGTGEENDGLCDLGAESAMLGLELGRMISGSAAGGQFYFPVAINGDGTARPDIFVLEHAGTPDTFGIDLLTNNPGEATVVAATVPVQNTDYGPTGTLMTSFSGGIGGVGIDLDAITPAVSNITGVQLPGGTGLDPCLVAAVPPSGFTIAPIAVMRAQPTSGGAPLPVAFDATCGSYDPDGAATFAWDYTNDGADDATGPSASHIYNVAGTFVAKLTVTDSDNLTDDDTVSIQISGLNPMRKIIELTSDAGILTSVRTEFPGGTPTFLAADLVGPPDTNDGGTPPNYFFIEFDGFSETEADLVGLNLSTTISSPGAGGFIRAFFPADVVINPDGTDAPEVFVIEAAGSTDDFQFQLLTSGPGEPPQVATAVQVYQADYQDVGGGRGGIGLDLDVLGVGGIRGVQIPGSDGLGGVSGIDPAVIAGVPTRCNTPFADTDGDGDVDQVDFSVFQACFTGGSPAPGTFDAVHCLCLDRDADNDVDELDYGDFEDCATGPGVAWSQAGSPNCQP